jgi:hypothetical protein
MYRSKVNIMMDVIFSETPRAQVQIRGTQPPLPNSCPVAVSAFLAPATGKSSSWPGVDAMSRHQRVEAPATTAADGAVDPGACYCQQDQQAAPLA